MKILAPILIAAAATTQTSSCNAPVGEYQRTSNTKVVVDFLFEHEGCRGYAVHGASRQFFYVRCPRESTRADWQTEEKQGKTTVFLNHEAVTP